ncbi:MAG: DUF1223 domain-containing protein [Gammaproteobacteria bacterium]
MRNILKLFAAGLCGVCAAGFPAAAVADEAGLAPPCAVVELFTSQGCYSCPPAEKVLAENFAVLPEVLALEFHVDYWDDLVYGGSVWADPFSNRKYTERQTGYNVKLRNTRGVYTPQAIIQGGQQAGGTQKDRISSAVRESLAQTPSVRFRFNGRKVRAEGALPPGVQMFYAVYWRKRETEVAAGENKGKLLHNTNVVTTLKRLPFGAREAELPEIDSAVQGCAVWMQQGRSGKIISAAKCPA